MGTPIKHNESVQYQRASWQFSDIFSVFLCVAVVDVRAIFDE